MLRIIAAAAAVIMAAGCASIVTGNTQNITISSDPAGASIILNGAEMAKTPATIDVPRKSGGLTFQIKKDGYKPMSVTTTTALEPWFFGNIVLGGLIGSTTDAASGSVVRYSPDAYFVTLEEDATSNAAMAMGMGRRRGQVAEIRNFILSTYNHLAGDIMRGRGDYLGTLLDLLNSEPQERSLTIRRLQSALDLSGGNILGFADLVLDQFLPEAPRRGPSADPVQGIAPVQPTPQPSRRILM